MTPVRRVCGLLLLATLLAGCKVDARVDVTLQPDGSGTVSARVALDASAVRQVTVQEPLARAVPLRDLRAAGWTVSKWTPVRGGGEAITVTHGFVGRADLARRLADLDGAHGALRDPVVTHSHSYFGSRDALSIDVDLTHVDARVKSDAVLAQRLRDAGVDVNALDAQLGRQLRRAVALTVSVRVAGSPASVVRLTAGQHATVGATRSLTFRRRVVLLATGGGLLLVALVVFTAASLLSRRRRRRTS